MPRPYKKQFSLEQRFWSKVKIGLSNHCWEWIGAKEKNGYGHIKVNGKTLKAHRISWELHNNQSANNKCVLHSCDNPSCVNPHHLSLGTFKDNSTQCSYRQRFNHHGEHNGNSKLTMEDVILIRAFYRQGIKRKLICQKFQISKQHLINIAKGKCWSCPNPETVPVLWRE